MAIKIQEIINTTPEMLASLSQDQLGKITARAVKLATNRVEKLRELDAMTEAAGTPMYIPALKAINRPGGGVYAPKSDDPVELQKAFDSAVRVLRMQTSTPTSARKYWRDLSAVRPSSGRRSTGKLTKEEAEQVFGAIDELRSRKTSRSVKAYYESAKMIGKAKRMVKNGATKQDVIDALEREYQTAYEEAQKNNAGLV